ADGEFVYGLNFTLQRKPAAVSEEPAKNTPTPAFAPQRQVSGGEFVLESMTCRLASDCNAMTAKIRRLGYEPILTSVDATMHMLRLRLGPFAGKKLKQTLALARTIEPGSYSVPVGGSYVIQAGAYLMQEYLDRQVSRFEAKGIKVHLEPVKVAKTLHLIRFGSFAIRTEAEAAARTAAAGGVQVEVVRTR